jgi:coenzyme F420-reducing hydrogenase beta subunit
MIPNKETIYLARPEQCTGCAACANVCPVSALTMKTDAHGFVVPTMDETLCIDCYKCQKVCPVLKNPQGSIMVPSCYAAMAKDEIRRASSSGGIFSLLAKFMLLKGGVVCGATMDENLHVKHVCISSVSDLPQIQGSKYVQSDIGMVYRQVESYLKQGKNVLFSGCPCQVAGLKKFLGKYYTDLFLVDILCHGVPSQQIFQKYLNENAELTNVQSVQFRDKTQGWVCNTLTLKLKDGTQLIHSYEKSEFERGLHNNLFLRESCYDCPFCDFPRQGDLTLGDFWGIEQFEKALNDQKGTSLILVNSEKGQQMLEQVRGEMSLCTPVPLEYALKNNRLHSKIVKHPGRDRFWELFKKYSFTKAADYALNDRHDLGVIGCWSVENHGSNMTYYALYRVLRDMGLEPLMIERPADALWPPRGQPDGFAQSPYRAYDLSPVYHNKSEMKVLNQKCDTFLLGSDQLLYHDLYRSFNEFADMSYIHANKKKIAYATSVGREEFQGIEEQRAKLSLWLKQFDFVSVREDSGVSLLHNTFGVEAQCVLDPVFLCPPHYYIEMAQCGKPFSMQPYMAVYMVDPNPKKDVALQYASKHTGLTCHMFSDVARSASDNGKVTNEDWLRSIMECSFFITDSFHGICFAIVFHKPFICIANPYRGLSRFTSLLGQLGLMNRMVNSSAEIMQRPELFEPVDYTCVDLNLKEEIRKSHKWLEQAYTVPICKPVTFYDLLDDRIDEMELRLKQANEKIYATETWLSNTHQRVDRIEPIIGRIDAMEPWLNNTHQRVDRIELIVRRIDALEQSLKQKKTRSLLDALKDDLGEINRIFHAIFKHNKNK